jgi:hypothetical protein
MWEIFLVALGFAIGRLLGTINKDQDGIDQANERAETIRQLWLDAEEKSETWKRRYLNLVPTEKD